MPPLFLNGCEAAAGRRQSAFLKRGRPGDKVNADIFLNFRDFFLRFKKYPEAFVGTSLFGSRSAAADAAKDDLRGKDTAFFPDAITQAVFKTAPLKNPAIPDIDAPALSLENRDRRGYFLYAVTLR